MGERDIMTPIKGAKYLHNYLPNSNLVVLKDIGHFHILEAPLEVNGEIEKSLEI